MSGEHTPGSQFNGERPCLPPGLAREFDEHVRYLKGSIASCGIDHARGVARMLAGICHDPERLMFHAILELEMDRAMLAFTLVAEKARFHQERAAPGSNLSAGLDEIAVIASARRAAIAKAKGTDPYFVGGRV